MDSEKFRIRFGDMDIRVHKQSPTMFDVVVGNCKTGNGILMCSVEQERQPYPFYKVVNLQVFSEEKSSIDSQGILLQLIGGFKL
ncbi:hypothetical protein [Priestia taiwanensis]|uniref:Uncharacterized protein n=1 Tax=Priestia taiwanensis TaxID=1347902 RepID=A0A917ALM1_9BACI|nr:hypothetical protein [Priestia taiwanensis]MBM7361987.1 hypothetical protein [Priestia taiwanensis]GGE58552.1 hypothetical protein GCM10007140_06120 [Priestia taiwanensis]